MLPNPTSNRPPTNNSVASETIYFENSHVFLLAGHGKDISNERYKLKENEFYATPTKCGRLGLVFVNDYIKFLHHNPSIKIPNPANTESLYPLNYNNFPFKKTSSINKSNLALFGLKRKINTEDGFKIYHSNTKFKYTNTIPGTHYYYFNQHLIKENVRPKTYGDTAFEYGGKTDYIYSMSSYNIFQITISGAINPNTSTDSFDNALQVLLPSSNELEKIFELKPAPPHTLTVIFSSNDQYNGELFSSNISYYKYLKYVLDLMSSLSGINYRELIDITRPDLKLFDVLTFGVSMNDLFTKLREKVGDDKPIFVINPLCRESTFRGRHEHTLRNNSNIESNILRTTRSKNINSRYIRKRNITRRYVLHNAFKRILNMTYKNGVRKSNLKSKIFENLSNIPSMKWSSYLYSIPADKNTLITRNYMENPTTLRALGLQYNIKNE